MFSIFEIIICVMHLGVLTSLHSIKHINRHIHDNNLRYIKYPDSAVRSTVWLGMPNNHFTWTAKYALHQFNVEA